MKTKSSMRVEEKWMKSTQNLDLVIMEFVPIILHVVIYVIYILCSLNWSANNDPHNTMDTFCRRWFCFCVLLFMSLDAHCYYVTFVWLSFIPALILQPE